MQLSIRHDSAVSSSTKLQVALRKSSKQGCLLKAKGPRKADPFSCVPPDTASSQNPLGCPGVGPGLDDSAVKLPPVEIRGYVQEGRRQRKGAQGLTLPLREKQVMKLNQQQTHRKPWSSAMDSGSTGELDHRELVIKGDSTKGTQKAQRKQQITPRRWEKTGLWGTTSTLMIFVIILIKAFFLVIPPWSSYSENKKKDIGAKSKRYRLEVP